MRPRLIRMLSPLALAAMLGSFAYAQGGTTSTLAGVAVDAAGGVVPGADVVVTHKATAVTQRAVTNADGAFSFPGLNIGTYSVAVTLQGFKAVLIDDVVLTSGAGANVRAVLEVGGVSEQVTVSSTSEIVQTQSSTISNTINTNQIMKLPLTSRSAMDFVTFMPGVSTPGGNRDSTINGLPQGSINITLDGVNIQDNTNKTGDGFFAIVSPRLDAMEEVTVTTAAQGSDGAGQGAVQIKFVTRSGTNQYSGSLFEFYRNDKLNANTWFNNRDGVDKAKLLQNQFGGRLGGPIAIPGLFDGRGKAFFFVNYEEFRQPADITRNRTVLNPLAQQGIYTYNDGGTMRQVNLLQLATNNGQVNTADPIVAALLTDIRTATGSVGALTDIDPNLQRFTYNLAVTSLRRFPTARVDYNLTSSHRFSTSLNYNYFTDSPDTLNNRDASFPGFPVEAGQTSKRLSFSNSLRSTLSPQLVNEGRVAFSGAPVKFFSELNPAMYTGTLAGQGGFHLNFPTVGSQLTAAGAVPAPQSRDATTLLVEDTLTWLNGTHSLSLGATWTQNDVWLKNSALIPQLTFGVISGDPAQGLFTAANFQGASAANLTAAQNLYALLTGRVSAITGDARINESTGEYEFMGTGTQRARMRDAGLFVQDAWRVRPSLTINAGLRYELQLPFTPLNSSYSTATMADICGISGQNASGECNLFQPGVTTGKKPEFINFGEGVRGYNIDYDNLAPSAGFAWTLGGRSGLLGTIFGPSDGDSVLRGGFSRSYNRNGMGDFTGQYAQNPGVVINASRSANLGNLNDGTGLPVLFRQGTRLGAPAFASTPVYPMTDSVAGDVNIFDPNIEVPYADSWSVGLQRAVSRNMAVEVRYVGTRSRQNWETLNYNEINIFENRFLDEFKLAQQNLQANLAANRGGNFAYFGPGTGTAPLPIIFSYFRGAGDASNPALYTSANFSSNTFLTPLATFNPNPFGFAGNLFNDASRRTNAANAGLPANFFLVNPDLQGGADLTTNSATTDFNSLQVELRRRLSQGLQFQTSYVLGRATNSVFQTWRRPRYDVRNGGAEGDVTHAVKANVVYDFPFGQGRRFGASAGGLMERLIGGWQLGLTTRVQSGRLVDLGNVRVVGMSLGDVQDIFELRFDDSGKKVFMWPQDVIDNTVRAFSVSATSATGYSTLGTPTGRYFAPANGPDCIEVDNGADYGDCGTRSLVVTGPMFREVDLSLAKRVTVVGRSNFEFRLEMLNVFNRPNFVPVGGIGSDPVAFEVTGLTGTNPARVIQLVTRFNW
ncbi:MAG TPA: carboxypeptidase regulatory-like domain-containing protein [Vicinamibacterales bacterium]|nr:carboxypeptidase regulatory-like domain-containing protein [Vicinamibacterales bacterium]